MKQYPILHNPSQLVLDEPGFKMPNQQISATTDDEAFESWLKNRASRSKHTYDSYQRIIRRFYDWLRNARSINLRAVTNDILVDYRLFLESLDEQYRNEISYVQDVVADWSDIRWRNVDNENRPKHSLQNTPPLLARRKRNCGVRKTMFLTPRSIEYNLLVVNAFLRYLAKVGYLPFDPTAALPKRDVSKKKADRYFEVKDWEIIFRLLKKLEPEDNNKSYDKVRAARARWLFALGYLTGLRRTEIISARMNHIFVNKGRFILKVWGKGKNKNDPHDFDKVLLNDACVVELNIYRNALGLPNHTGIGEDRPLVGNLGRRPCDAMKEMSGSGIRKCFIEIRDRLIEVLKDEHPALAARLESTSLHWLRHTGGSHRLENGLQLDQVQQWFRHKDVATTMLYTHHEEDVLHDAFNLTGVLPE